MSFAIILIYENQSLFVNKSLITNGKHFFQLNVINTTREIHVFVVRNYMNCTEENVKPFDIFFNYMLHLLLNNVSIKNNKIDN